MPQQPLSMLRKMMSGGGPDVVIVQEAEPVQLAEDVQAFVYAKLPDGSRVKSANRATLHHGQWVATLPAAK